MIEVPKVILPEEWDLFPEFGTFYEERIDNLSVKVNGDEVTLNYSDASESYALWTGLKSDVDKFAFPKVAGTFSVPASDTNITSNTRRPDGSSLRSGEYLRVLRENSI